MFQGVKSLTGTTKCVPPRSMGGLCESSTLPGEPGKLLCTWQHILGDQRFAWWSAEDIPSVHWTVCQCDKDRF